MTPDKLQQLAKQAGFVQDIKRKSNTFEGSLEELKCFAELILAYEPTTLKFVQTCGACPEQYDVFDDQDKQVAYVRLRFGQLRVDVPDCDGETIFIKDFEDKFKGVFTDTERDKYLKLIEAKIKEQYNGSV